MRTREEITAKIENLEHKRFILAMKDMWNDKDFDEDRAYKREIRELEAELKNIA